MAKKAYHRILTRGYLDYRYPPAGPYNPKWVQFCRTMLGHGFTVVLYEARETVSKYVTVERDGKQFKVRFSNHKPSRYKERNRFCDFFVGINHGSITTTAQAVTATLRHFGVPCADPPPPQSLNEQLYGADPHANLNP